MRESCDPAWHHEIMMMTYVGKALTQTRSSRSPVNSMFERSDQVQPHISDGASDELRSAIIS
jgi:hypothetical protein